MLLSLQLACNVLRLLMCLLGFFPRGKMLEMPSIHPYKHKSKVVGFTEQDDDVCFQSFEILVILKYTQQNASCWTTVEAGCCIWTADMTWVRNLGWGTPQGIVPSVSLVSLTLARWWAGKGRPERPLWCHFPACSTILRWLLNSFLELPEQRSIELL